MQQQQTDPNGQLPPQMCYGYPPMFYNPYMNMMGAPQQEQQFTPIDDLVPIITEPETPDTPSMSDTPTTPIHNIVVPSRTPPRIVVTPTPEEQAKKKIKDEGFLSLSESLEKVNSTFSMLSQKLSEFSANMNKNDKTDDEFSCKEEDEEEYSDSDNEENNRRKNELLPQNGGMKSMKSISNVSLYDGSDVECITEEEEEEEEDEVETIYDDEEIIPHRLSVIMEESETAYRKASMLERCASSASTLSDCSTTIGHYDDMEDNEKTDDEFDNDLLNNYDHRRRREDEEIDDDSSITVRLPLRLSASRSSNDDRERESDRDLEKANSGYRLSACAKDSSYSSLHESDNENEVSVTFSLNSRSNSVERSNRISKTPSIEMSSSRMSEYDDSDSEVSVSISLPIRKSKSRELQSESSRNQSFEQLKRKEDDEIKEEEEEEDVSVAETSSRSEKKILTMRSMEKLKELFSNKPEKEKASPVVKESTKMEEPPATEVDIWGNDEEEEELSWKRKWEIRRENSGLSDIREKELENEKDVVVSEIKKSKSHKKVIEAKKDESENEELDEEECEYEEESEEEEVIPVVAPVKKSKSIKKIVAPKKEESEEEETEYETESEEEEEIKPEPAPTVKKSKSVKKVVDLTKPSTNADSESEYETEYEEEEIVIIKKIPAKPVEVKKSKSIKKIDDQTVKKSKSVKKVIAVESSSEEETEYETESEEEEEEKVKPVQPIAIKKSQSIKRIKSKIIQVKQQEEEDDEEECEEEEEEEEESEEESEDEEPVKIIVVVKKSPSVKRIKSRKDIKMMDMIPTPAPPPPPPTKSIVTPPKVIEPESVSSEDEESEEESSESEEESNTENTKITVIANGNRKNSRKPETEDEVEETIESAEEEEQEEEALTIQSKIMENREKLYDPWLNINSTPIELNKPQYHHQHQQKSEQTDTIVNGGRCGKTTTTPYNLTNPKFSFEDVFTRLQQIDNGSSSDEATPVTRNYNNKTPIIDNTTITAVLPPIENGNDVADVLSRSTRVDEKEIKISIRDRIAVFEATTPTINSPITVIEKCNLNLNNNNHNSNNISSNNSSNNNSSSNIPITNTTTPISTIKNRRSLLLSQNNSSQRSSQEDSEIDEDSGVTSDMSRHNISETDTESECFPELKKMSRYQRAATHSRLFKLLQDECGDDDGDGDCTNELSTPTPPQAQAPVVTTPVTATAKNAYKSKKIIHNVSITRKQNPNLAKEAETMSQRRERLCLPLQTSTSIDCDSISSSGSSPTGSNTQINDKLVNELVQSLLLKKKSVALRDLPMEKLHAAAKKVLLEDLDSSNLDTFSSSDDVIPTVDSTPALTPQEFKNSAYSDYYDTWNTADQKYTYEILPSKAFKTLQEQQLPSNISGSQRKIWAARCPRVLSSKTVNRDLSRVTEIRESESPDPLRMSSSPLHTISSPITVSDDK